MAPLLCGDEAALRPIASARASERAAEYRRHPPRPTRDADAILAGCLLAVVFAERPWRAPRWATTAAVAGLTVASLVTSLDFLVVAGLPIATVSAAVLVAGAAQQDHRALTLPPLVYLGTISYGLYLWHLPVLAVGLINDAPLWVMLLLSALAIGIAAISRRFVETPFLRSRRPRMSGPV